MIRIYVGLILAILSSCDRNRDVIEKEGHHYRWYPSIQSHYMHDEKCPKCKERDVNNYQTEGD